MQGKKYSQPKLYTTFKIEARVPKDNFYRRLKEVLDLRFLYSQTKELEQFANFIPVQDS